MAKRASTPQAVKTLAQLPNPLSLNFEPCRYDRLDARTATRNNQVAGVPLYECGHYDPRIKFWVGSEFEVFVF